MKTIAKLVKDWETKNARNAAKASGISMMALSLAACGGGGSAPAPVVVVEAVTNHVSFDNLERHSGWHNS